jgi:hypothetical protein
MIKSPPGYRRSPTATKDSLGPGRLTDRSVARILKSRVRALLTLRGKIKAEADELVERFSGHNMRAICARLRDVGCRYAHPQLSPVAACPA